jgi:hypothetical protein
VCPRRFLVDPEDPDLDVLVLSRLLPEPEVDRPATGDEPRMREAFELA